MPQPRKLINEPPQSFAQVAATLNDAKELLACHGTLHQWAKEITSASPVYEIGEHRWTLPWVVAAHDAVVQRLTQIKPKFEHDSPIGERVQGSFTKKPIVLLMGAVSVTAVNEKEAVVDAEPQVLALGAMANLRRAFPGRELAEAPIVGSAATVYHLVLISDETLRELKQNRIQAAVDGFRSSLGSLFHSPRLQSGIVMALAETRAAALTADDAVEARERGQEIGKALIAERRVKASEEPKKNPYRKAQTKAGMERIERLLGDLANPRLLARAEEMLEAALDGADSRGSPVDKDAAIEAALRAARLIGVALRGQQ
jgi:hypothetical protein